MLPQSIFSILQNQYSASALAWRPMWSQMHMTAHTKIGLEEQNCMCRQVFSTSYSTCEIVFCF